MLKGEKKVQVTQFREQHIVGKTQKAGRLKNKRDEFLKVKDETSE